MNPNRLAAIAAISPLTAWAATLALLASACSSSSSSGPAFVTQPASDAPANGNYDYVAQAAGLVPPITWNLSSAPAGMTVDNMGRVTWTPTLADLGTYLIELEASDAQTTLMQSWNLVVHQDLLMGVSYSPRRHTNSSTNSDVVQFLSASESWGRLISFHSVWRDSVAAAGQEPGLAGFARAAQSQFGIEPAIGFGWASGGVGDLTSDSAPMDNTWGNLETRAEFLSMVTNFAAANQPEHLFLGNEVNSWYLNNVADWPNWLSMLSECYDAIKAVSPDTLVFTVFQLERLKGVGGGTTGWMDAPHWNVVDDVAASGKIDAIGFTSYAYFEYAIPQAIPANYYDEIAMHWSGPVIFTEIGWPGTASFPFPGGQADQATFVDKFFELTGALDIEYVTWLFLYDWDDQATVPGFMDIGFRNNDETLVRPSDAAWQAAVALRERP